jgi:hypothetical protein
MSPLSLQANVNNFAPDILYIYLINKMSAKITHIIIQFLYGIFESLNYLLVIA